MTASHPDDDPPGSDPAAFLEGHFQAIVASSDDAIVSKTLDGVVLSWNPAAERMFGWSAAEMIGQRILRVIPAERRDEEAMILARIGSGLAVDHFETVRVHRNGGPVHVSVTVSPIHDRAGRVVGASKIARDVGLRQQRDRAVWELAHRDGLTGIANRRGFLQEVARAIVEEEGRPTGLAVLFLDLDRFKQVNELHGHEAGDRLLCEVAQRLQQALRPHDRVARLGGDEFAVLLRHYPDLEQASLVGSRLATALSRPLQWGELRVEVSASFGLAAYPADGRSGEQLLACADKAMYAAKQLAVPAVVRWDPERHRYAAQRAVLLSALPGALARGELRLVYQPIIGLRGFQARDCEALLRWELPGSGAIPPDVFVPLAEQHGLIADIGDWVLRQVLDDLRKMPADFRVALNVSPLQLARSDSLCLQWPRLLQAAGVDAARITLELSEGALRDNAAAGTPGGDTLRRLREAGLQLAIDDFGTGWSSLASLHRLDFDVLKLDSSFIAELDRSERNRALCEAIVAMGHVLGTLVTAEGVETPAQLQAVYQLGCDAVQGGLFAHALPLADALTWMQGFNAGSASELRGSLVQALATLRGPEWVDTDPARRRDMH